MGSEMQAPQVIETPDGKPPLALELPEATTFEQWVIIGRQLCLGSQALKWHIGDWWAFGDHRYGDRARAAAEGIFGREVQTLMNMASVCRRFETSRRREDLTFTHHAEVVALPPTQADELLTKAERDHLSANLLRREVQAIKAANDPTPVAEPEPAQPSKPVPSNSAKAELTAAYEMVIEFAQALERLRPLTKRERRLFANASTFVAEAHSGHRPCPEDFDAVFVEQGRFDCEEWYRASRMTINRWLIERGKKRLIELRAEFIQKQRDAGRDVREDDNRELPTIDDRLYAVAREAAHFLRTSRYGGWTISPGPDGDWRVGTVRKTCEELITMAERQGFDRTAALRSTSIDEVNR